VSCIQYDDDDDDDDNNNNNNIPGKHEVNFILLLVVKVKVKLTLQHAMKSYRESKKVEL